MAFFITTPPRYTFRTSYHGSAPVFIDNGCQWKPNITELMKAVQAAGVQDKTFRVQAVRHVEKPEFYIEFLHELSDKFPRHTLSQNNGQSEILLTKNE